MKIIGDGETEMIAETRVMAPLRIDAKVLPAGLHLDNPQDAVRRQRQEVGAPAIRQRELLKHGEPEIVQKPARAARYRARRRYSFAVDVFLRHSVPTHDDFVSMARRHVRAKRDKLIEFVNPARPAKARE